MNCKSVISPNRCQRKAHTHTNKSKLFVHLALFLGYQMPWLKLRLGGIQTSNPLWEHCSTDKNQWVLAWVIYGGFPKKSENILFFFWKIFFVFYSRVNGLSDLWSFSKKLEKYSKSKLLGYQVTCFKTVEIAFRGHPDLHTRSGSTILRTKNYGCWPEWFMEVFQKSQKIFYVFFSEKYFMFFLLESMGSGLSDLRRFPKKVKKKYFSCFHVIFQNGFKCF